MQVQTNSLVQGVEVWRPDPSGECLEWCAGAYGRLASLEQGRRGRLYAPDAGVVGRAWATQSPALGGPDQGDFDDGYAPELPSQVVAIPAVRQGECRGVAVLLCGEHDAADGAPPIEGAPPQGAVEVWRPNDRGELSLAENWYCNLERFGKISQYVKFPRRAGLPGKVWADRFPRVMGSLGTSQSFVRVAGAKAEGLSTGLGVPFMKTALELEAVLVLLSSSRTPLAGVMEVWAKDTESSALKIVSADYGQHVDLGPVSRRRRLQPGDGIAGRVFRDEAPRFTNDLVGVEFPRGERFAEYGFEWGLGLPVFVGNQLVAAVTLFN